MRNVRLEVIRARMEQGKKYKAKLKHLEDSEYFTVTRIVYDGREPSVYVVYFQGRGLVFHPLVYDWTEIE